MKIRTHYDNLKVSRDAPAEVIRAAYKSLSQKYHPDRNPGDEEAAQIMRLINEAYEVLSDPQKREKHEQWIKTEEWKAAHRVESPQPPITSAEVHQPAPPSVANRKELPRWADRILAVALFPIGVILHVLRNLRTYIVIGFLCWLGVFTFQEHRIYQAKNEPVILSPEMQQKVLQDVEREAQATAASKVGYVKQASKPTAAAPMCSPPIVKSPNGSPWPGGAAYVGPITRTAGRSTVTIDNSSGGSNIWIKLAKPTDKKAAGIREAYIPKGATFTMNKIEPGTYAVKYKDVATGCNSISAPFVVEQTRVNNRIQYSQITLTIYMVLNGNMDFDQLPEAAF